MGIRKINYCKLFAEKIKSILEYVGVSGILTGSSRSLNMSTSGNLYKGEKYNTNNVRK